jgi:hypothetical protein
MLRRALHAAGALLVVFHVWLLAGQLADGSLAAPGVLVRWLLAGGLVAALVQLRRQGTSVLVGRKAGTVWLLAAWLHGPAIAARVDSPALPEASGTIAQIGVVVTVLGLALLVLGRTRPSAAPQFLAGRLVVRVEIVSPPAAYALDTLAPRPPPALA